MTTKRIGIASTKNTDLQTSLQPITSELRSPQHLEDKSSNLSPAHHATPTKPSHIGARKNYTDAKLVTAPTVSTSPSTQEISSEPRQVIAVSASKGPTAFFNLARKFLVTDEMCDLSALEGAIVSAVDAAHLLERSKLATIVRCVDVFCARRDSFSRTCLYFVPNPFSCSFDRVQTSYVTVEPKRKKLTPGTPPLQPILSRDGVATSVQSGDSPSVSSQQGTARPAGGRELRRARIVITVQRTESYKQWLEDNPLQRVITEDGDEDHAIGDIEPTP